MQKHLIASFEPYAREPILRRMEDGTLVCAFLTGGENEPHNDNVVMLSKSHDDGATWSAPEVLFSHRDRGCWCTEIFTDTPRPFAVVHTYNAPSHYRELQTFISYFDGWQDGFTEPVTMPGSVNGCSVRQGIRMSNGEMLFPLYWQETRQKFQWEDNPWNWDCLAWQYVSGVGISSGDKFFRHGYLATDAPLWEPNAAELENGHIIMYMRCSGKGCLYIAHSYDYGRSWSDPAPSEIPNPDTKVTVLKIRGRIIMINNFASEGRTNLQIASSEDGISFTPIVCVEPPEESWFYPHAFACDASQTLYVAYENKKQHYLKKYKYSELGL
ncbi:MAG: exo-alpha-sialidase [Clostridia bacterium]|nr:exo-alpha-sialidase [Clostridia bacterium]